MKVIGGFLSIKELIWEVTKAKPENTISIEDVDGDYLIDILEVINGKIKVRLIKMPF